MRDLLLNALQWLPATLIIGSLLAIAFTLNSWHSDYVSVSIYNMDAATDCRELI